MSIFQPIKQAFLEYSPAQDHLWKENGQQNNLLLFVALGSFVLGAALLLKGGLQTGFLPLHQTGQSVLPGFAWENITFVGDTATALALALLFTFKHPRLTLAILFSAIIGTLLIHGLKGAIQTPRPPAVFSSDVLNIIGPSFKRLSMPSGHTATAFILAGVLTQCFSQTYAKWLLIFGACLIGFSRIACGVHWPADVLMGASLGLCSAWLGLYLSLKVKLHFAAYLAINILLIISALYLFSFDGGFESTQWTAPLIGTICLAFWLSQWSKHLKEIRTN